MTADIWAGLPPADCRWTWARKQEVAAAIRFGLLSLSQARVFYSLSTAELLQWERERGKPGPYRAKALRSIERRFDKYPRAAVGAR